MDIAVLLSAVNGRRSFAGASASADVTGDEFCAATTAGADAKSAAIARERMRRTSGNGFGCD